MACYAGPSSSCGGIRPSAKASFAWAKNAYLCTLLCLFKPIFVFISNLTNFQKDQKPEKGFSKNNI